MTITQSHPCYRSRMSEMGSKERERIAALPPGSRRGVLANHHYAPLTDAEVDEIQAAAPDALARGLLIEQLRKRHPDCAGLLGQFAAWSGLDYSTVWRDAHKRTAPRLELAARREHAARTMGQLERFRLGESIYAGTYAPLSDDEARRLGEVGLGWRHGTVARFDLEHLVHQLRSKYPHAKLAEQMAAWLGISRATMYRILAKRETP